MVHVESLQLPWILKIKLFGITTSAVGFVDKRLVYVHFEKDAAFWGRATNFLWEHNAQHTTVLNKCENLHYCSNSLRVG